MGGATAVVDKVVKKAADTTADVSSGVTTTLEDASEGITTTLGDATEGLGTAIETTKSNLGGLTEDIKGGFKYYKEGLADKMGAGNLLGGVTAAAETAMGGGDPGSKEAPGKSATMGQGGQGGMKSATMEAVKKTAGGAGGKRRLRKVSKSGAKV